jgi:NADH-quinone oxidoreductase subunit L
VINAMHHEQDMRKMGGLAKKIPLTFWMMIAGTLALTGVPFTSGFFSKDAIIEASFASHRVGHLYAFLMVTIAAGLTSFYSWRLIFMTFFGEAKWQHADAHSAHAPDHAEPPSGHDAAHGADAHVHAAHHGHEGEHAIDPHESPNVMMIPLYVLAFGALFAGAAFVHTFIGVNSPQFWKNALYVSADNHLVADMENVPFFITLLPTIFMIVGLLMALRFYILSPSLPNEWAKRNPLLYRFLLNKWYFDELYDFLFVRPAFWLGRLFWKGGDQGIIDRFGPDGVAARVVDVTRNVVKLQSGYLYHYAFAMLIGVAAFVTYYLMRGLH